MLNIVLLEPEIPSNTGNIARSCAATGTRLHLIEPLGFDISDKAVKRAGLDYWQYLDLSVWDSIEDFFAQRSDENLWLATTKAPRSYTEASYGDGDFLVFGRETRGLPENLLEKRYADCVRIPMRPEARSLNLSNSVAIMLFEALRQQGFPNLKETGSMLNED